jgi:DNA-binding response OmpR family regulator
MSTGGTLLCIHRHPGQLLFLQEHGYELVTASNGHDGLRLFRSRSVDAILLDYHLGQLDGSTVAYAIKQVRPEVPIVMLTDRVEMPSGALKSVDALVADADGPNSLLATVHSVLNREQGANPHVNPKDSRCLPDSALEDSFAPEIWNSIRTGDVQF